MVLGAAGGKHLEIALGKTNGCTLVDRVERVHQAIAEGISIDVERRMHEMRDIGPERLIARLELDRLPEALPLHLEPQRVEALGGEFPLASLRMQLALEGIERDLAHHSVDHVLDLGGEHRL